MQPNILTRREYKGKIYVKNIRKNSYRIRNHLKVGSGSEKDHFVSTTLTFTIARPAYYSDRNRTDIDKAKWVRICSVRNMLGKFGPDFNESESGPDRLAVLRIQNKNAVLFDSYPGSRIRDGKKSGSTSRIIFPRTY